MDDSCVSVVQEYEESESRDRLSELHDPLILDILSLLPMRDVVRTTLLSKRWNGLWTKVPRLSFLLGMYGFVDKFRNLVHRVIALWNGTKILTFSLTIMLVSDPDSRLVSDLDSWLHFAIEKQVEELRLDLKYCMNTVYCPPHLLYSCSSIIKLTLVNCNLKIEGNVQWNQLKSLVIREVDSLSENAMDRILSGAPRLEVLDLRIMDSSLLLNIRSSSLKSLKIDRRRVSNREVEETDSMLIIWAPNLETLEISGVPCRRCLLNVPSVTNAILGLYDRDHYKTAQYFGDVLLEGMLRQVFQSLHHVGKITLSYWCIKVLFDMKMNNMLVSFSNVKFLKLYADAADEVLLVVEMFPQLMMLEVERSGWNHRLTQRIMTVDPCVEEFDSCNLLEPYPSVLQPRTIDLTWLRTVDVSWYMHEQSDTSIFQVIEIVLENAERLEKMVIWPKTFDPNPEMLSMAEEMVFGMVRSSPAAEVIVMPWTPFP